MKMQWLICPVCGSKTRNKIRDDTVILNFPLFCPKCKQETLINVQNFQVKVISKMCIRDSYGPRQRR